MDTLDDDDRAKVGKVCRMCGKRVTIRKRPVSSLNTNLTQYYEVLACGCGPQEWGAPFVDG